jgi:hypothetical protein
MSGAEGCSDRTEKDAPDKDLEEHAKVDLHFSEQVELVTALKDEGNKLYKESKW